jgi:hypothetical protein
VHLTCPDLGLKDYPIKQPKTPIEGYRTLEDSVKACCVFFERNTRLGSKTRLVIYAPVLAPIKSFHYSLSNLLANERDPVRKAYLQNMQTLSEHLLVLLNADNPAQSWRFAGFDPRATQKSLITRHNKRIRKSLSEKRKQAREEEKRKQREAKRAEKLAANPPSPLSHGAGRTVGARPGIYRDVQMRSQLEIRFAAELDERGIKWVYEGEALGASSYLVDFYLPELGVWVEVKGKFEPRDRQVLPEVAKYLKTERKHRLLVYSGSGMCYVVNPSGFREVERKNFWDELIRLK